MSGLPTSAKLMSKRFTRCNPFSQECLSLIQNQNMRGLIQLIIQKQKSSEDIHKIGHHLEHVLGLDYFQELKGILTQADYSTVIEQLRVQFRFEGTVIIEKRKRNDSFYIILDGVVKVLDQIQYSPGEDNRDDRYEIINKLHQGESFGDASLLNPRREATARVEAMTNCLLLTLDHQIFTQIVSKITLIKKQQKTNILSGSSLFYGINKSCFKDVIVEMQEHKYGLNEIIFSPGELHESLYFIKSGTVEISENSVKLMTLVAGENFGVERADIDQSVDRIRCQEAKSRSNGVVVYKLKFARLKVLQGYYQEFLQNLRRQCFDKKRISDKLLVNHQKIKKLLTLSNTISGSDKKQFVLRKKFRTRTVSKIPEWWGTVDRPEDQRVKSKQHNDKQNTPLIPGLLGSKRIEELKKLVIKHKSVPNQPLQFPNYPSYFGELKCSHSKKRMTKTITNESCQILIKKKTVPKYKKQRLVGYAKSSVNCWDLAL